MNKKLLVLLFLTLGISATAFAERNVGYLYTGYGEVVRGAYGHCIHTAYFDPSEGLAECGEGPGQENDYSGG